MLTPTGEQKPYLLTSQGIACGRPRTLSLTTQYAF